MLFWNALNDTNGVCFFSGRKHFHPFPFSFSQKWIALCEDYMFRNKFVCLEWVHSKLARNLGQHRLVRAINTRTPNQIYQSITDVQTDANFRRYSFLTGGRFPSNIIWKPHRIRLIEHNELLQYKHCQLGYRYPDPTGYYRWVLTSEHGAAPIYPSPINGAALNSGSLIWVWWCMMNW